jgi:hypothetical protein
LAEEERTMPDATAGTAGSVGDRLLASSARFARSAATAYSDEAWDVFYLHLATAVEQLVKAVLARAHPLFIADVRSNSREGFDLLLHLCGFGQRARTPDFVAALRTITTSEALERVSLLVDGYQPHSPLVDLLFSTRNGIVHAGNQGRARGDDVLGDVARYIGPLLSSQGVDPKDFWGDSAGMVALHAQRRLDASEARYRRRLQSAKEQYARLLSRMDEHGLAAYLAAVAPGFPAEPYTSALAECPACGETGLITGSSDPRWEADWDTDGGIPYVDRVHVSEIRLDADGFRCRVCGLDLGADDLAFAGLARITLTDNDCDLSEAAAYFERQAADESWGDY